MFQCLHILFPSSFSILIINLLYCYLKLHYKICWKLCQVEALDGSDKIVLENIDKKWKKEDVSTIAPLATIFFILYFCE